MVVKRHRHGGELYYVIEQSDGTLAHLPAWMTRCEAADLPDRSPPRLALAALQDLRRLLDQVLSSSASQSQRGGDHAQGSTTATGSVCQPGSGTGLPLPDANDRCMDGREMIRLRPSHTVMFFAFTRLFAALTSTFFAVMW